MYRVVSLKVPFWDQHYLSCILMTSVVSQVLKYILFADDTNLLCCDRNLNELVRMINGGLEQLQTWFPVNRLSLNISKTNYMIFGNCRITADICVRINKEKINRLIT